jgi:hypothetical protein
MKPIQPNPRIRLWRPATTLVGGIGLAWGWSPGEAYVGQIIPMEVDRY